MQLTLPRLPEAISREHPRQRMQQHLSQTKSFSQSAGELPCSAAIGNQHTTTNVMPTVKGDLSDCSRHRLNSEVKSTFGQLLGLLTKSLPKRLKLLLGRQGIRTLIALRSEHRRESPHLQATQQQMSIGDGQGTTTSITGRAWISTSRAWANRQATAILSNDRSSARRHGVNGQS